MLIYSIFTTIILITIMSFFVYEKIKTNHLNKISKFFYGDFFNLDPEFEHKDFFDFIKTNTFIVTVKNFEVNETYKNIPSEKFFLKEFKDSFPKDVNIHYENHNINISFIISFDCDENVIINTIEKITHSYPSLYFGISQCLKKEMLYTPTKTINNKYKKILTIKYFGNSKKSAEMGIFNKKNVYRFDSSDNKVLPKPNTEIETKIITAFKCRNITETNEIISSAFDNTDNYSQCMYIANNMLFLLHNILAKNNFTIGEVYGDNVNLYRWLAGATNKDSLIRTMQSWYQKAILHTENHSEKTNNIELKIEKYIEDNYNNDISITTMAEEFNVSTQYFSKYFKSQTGNNFLETLNRYRIKKALEILNETDLSMAEIATMTGFNNYKSFARNFKKYTGKIPSEYTKK